MQGFSAIKFSKLFLLCMFLAHDELGVGAAEVAEDDARNDVKRQHVDLEAQVQNNTAQIEQLQADFAAQHNLVTSLSDTVSTLQSEKQALLARLKTQERSVAFHVDFGQGSNGEVDIGTDEPVRFNRTLVNVGGAYDNTTGVFTAPLPGVYSFTLHIMVGAGQHDDIEVGIFTPDGFPHAVATAEGASHDTNDKGSCTAILELAQGDRVYARHNLGGTHLRGSLSTSFVGMLVHATTNEE